MLRTVLAAAVATLALAAPALASSEDAWAAFRADVRTACEALADVPEGATASYAVNPFGSESFGAALVTVTLRDGSADRMVCIYDKQARTAEMTAPFGEMPDRPTPAAMTGTPGESASGPGPLTQATAADAPAAPPQATLPAPAPDTNATPAPDTATDATPTGTLPKTTPTLTGTAGTNGWYRSAVTVNLAAAGTPAPTEIRYSATGADPSTRSIRMPRPWWKSPAR